MLAFKWYAIEMQIVNCPIATGQNLGFDNTRPSQMDSVDMFPSLLIPHQDPLSGK